MTQEHHPTYQNSPTYLPMNAAAAPAKPYRTEIQGILPYKRKIPHGWSACLRRKPSRNNDICMVNDEEGDIYKKLRERHPKLLYKLKVCEDPMCKNMPHEEEFNDDNYESIDKTTV